MRIKLTLKQKNIPQIIPINYQYPVSSFIYRTIELSDNEYSKWLHEKGFAIGNKKFKFFTFSMLNIPEREIINDRIKILSEEIELTVSMLSENSIEHFIIGMFENQRARIYDQISNAEFYIKTIEAIHEPEYSETMKFKTISPIVLSKKAIYEGRESEHYLCPDEEDYFTYFRKNLEDKYRAYCIAAKIMSPQSRALGISEEKTTQPLVNSFRPLNGYKPRLVKIKAGTAQETRVRGFIYSFELTADKEFMKLGYQSGFGKLNSLGFWCVAVVR